MPVTYDFYGKDVTEAIDNACCKLDVGHEQLDIEILKTGSAGIFGFAKKNAHIRVAVKQQQAVDPDDPFGVSDIFSESLKPVKKGEERGRQRLASSGRRADEKKAVPKKSAVSASVESGQVSQESIELLKAELLHLVELMGFPSSLEVTVVGSNVELILHGEYEAELVGEDGKVLDSLQYLFRKIAGRKVPEALRLNLDVGNYRTQRLEEMREKAAELAAQVKQDGKTQALPALSPAERREVHLLLQGDSEIRSRSVGEGMFKKVLIYKPGSSTKGRKGGRNRRRNLRETGESDKKSDK